jgi:hypothetical protein
MTTNIKAMEMHLRNAVASALAAQQRLSAARRSAGLPQTKPAIYTAAEVREQRVEWYAEWRGHMLGLMNAQHNPKYRRLAQMAISAHNKVTKAQSTAKLADQISAAGDTARAGGPELRPTGLPADILAAGKKRRIPRGDE